MSKWMNILLAAILASLILLSIPFLWLTYVNVADKGWIVLEGYPLAFTLCWGMAVLLTLVMECCLALPKYSRAMAQALALVTLFAIPSLNHLSEGSSFYGKQFLGQDLGLIYSPYWDLLDIFFVVLLVFNVALFLKPRSRTKLMIGSGLVLFLFSLWLVFNPGAGVGTATVWTAGAVALWWEEALWKRERGSIRQMLEKRDTLVNYIIAYSFLAPLIIFGLYDTTSFAVY